MKQLLYPLTILILITACSKKKTTIPSSSTSYQLQYQLYDSISYFVTTDSNGHTSKEILTNPNRVLTVTVYKEQNAANCEGYLMPGKSNDQSYFSGGSGHTSQTLILKNDSLTFVVDEDIQTHTILEGYKLK